LPTGVNIYYKGLQRVKTKKNGKEEIQWQYTGRKEGRIQAVNLYGGKVVENITQALAACVIRQQMLVIGQRYPVLFQVHDEIPFLVPEEEATEGLKWVLQQMSTTPVWAPGQPLAAEGNFGDTYGDAK